MKLFEDTTDEALDFTFDSRSDFEEEDLDDLLSLLFCVTLSFCACIRWIAPLMAGKASQYLTLSMLRVRSDVFDTVRSGNITTSEEYLR